MKRMLFIPLIFAFITSTAQTWVPSEAEWYYTKVYTMPPDTSYTKLSVSDSIFENKACKYFTVEKSAFCSKMPGELIYPKNDSVFLYDNQLKKFQLLYNISAQKGSSWYYHFIKNSINDLDSVKILIDSTSKVEYNSTILRKQYVSYIYKNNEETLKTTSEIIEFIGDINYFFNIPLNSYTKPEISCDGSFNKGIRCYSDSKLGHISFTPNMDCTYESKYQETISIADNFTDVFANYELNKIVFNRNYTNSIIKSNIYNINGVKQNVKLINNEIDISSLPKGVYILQVKQLDKNMYSKTFVKK